MLIGLLLAVSLRAAHELVGAGVLPALVHDLGGEAWAGPFFAAYGLAAAAGILAGGRAADMRGPVRPLAFGLGAFAAGMVGTGLAGSMPGVVVARTLEGFGGGIVSVVVSAAVIRSYDDAARPRVLAWLSAAWVVPGLVAPALAIGVAERFGWRVVFLGLAPLVALAAALVLPALRRLPAPRDERHTALAARSPLRGESFRVVGRSESRVSLLGGAVAVRGLVVFAFFGVESFLPLLLGSLRGAGGAMVAALLTLSALSWTAGAFLQSRACRRWSAPALARAGTLALLAGIGCALASLFESTPLGVGLAGWTLAGLGMGFAYNTATASAMALAPAGAEGATSAALGIADALASSAATALGGALLAAAQPTLGAAPLLVVASFLPAAAAAAASLAPARRLQTHPG